MKNLIGLLLLIAVVPIAFYLKSCQTAGSSMACRQDGPGVQKCCAGDPLECAYVVGEKTFPCASMECSDAKVIAWDYKNKLNAGMSEEEIADENAADEYEDNEDGPPLYIAIAPVDYPKPTEPFEGLKTMVFSFSLIDFPEHSYKIKHKVKFEVCPETSVRERYASGYRREENGILELHMKNPVRELLRTTSGNYLGCRDGIYCEKNNQSGTWFYAYVEFTVHVKGHSSPGSLKLKCYDNEEVICQCTEDVCVFGYPPISCQ